MGMTVRGRGYQKGGGAGERLRKYKFIAYCLCTLFDGPMFVECSSVYRMTCMTDCIVFYSCYQP